MYVCTILIFLIINYVVIELIIYVKFRYDKYSNELRNRSPTSCSEVAERSPISHRQIADQSPTSFSNSHARF